MTGARGHGIQFGPLIIEIFRGVKAAFVQNPIEIYTQYTGGKEVGFVSQTDLERAAQNIGREIHNQYMITYNPNNKNEGGLHQHPRRGHAPGTRSSHTPRILDGFRSVANQRVKVIAANETTLLLVDIPLLVAAERPFAPGTARRNVYSGELPHHFRSS